MKKRHPVTPPHFRFETPRSDEEMLTQLAAYLPVLVMHSLLQLTGEAGEH